MCCDDQLNPQPFSARNSIRTGRLLPKQAALQIVGFEIVNIECPDTSRKQHIEGGTLTVC